MPSAASGPAGPGHAVSGEQTRLPGGDDPVQRRGARRGGFDGLTPLPFRTVAIDRYLETIYCIAGEDEPVRPSRVAQWLGVKAPTVSIGLRRLRAGGWVRCELDRRITLTPAGSAAAQAIVRRHRLAECWLTDQLGMDWASAHLEANRVAASLSDEVLARLDAALGEPATCPHGDPIPGRTAPYGHLVPLADLAPGTVATVRRISEIIEHEVFGLLRELAAAGVRTGIDVTVEADGPAGEISLTVGDRRHALELDPAAARLIWVEIARPVTG
ncbi:MAG: metal-dependent transcriptional regulator [Candidatus Dormibacteria bacterium]